MMEQITTAGGVKIAYKQQALTYQQAIEPLLEKLDAHRGALFASSFEYPGRYTCWDIGFYNPPMAVTCVGSKVRLDALNQRGEQVLKMLGPWLTARDDLLVISQTTHHCDLCAKPDHTIFHEEQRSRQPSVFTVLRHLLAFFKSTDEAYLGLYGAFGYDLIFQFEAVRARFERQDNQRELVLYLPDEMVVINHRKEEAFIRQYEFEQGGYSTRGLPRDGAVRPYHSVKVPEKPSDHVPGEFAALVETAKERFACGDLFEVVPSQTFYRACRERPSQLFRRMRECNPAPYGFLINLGEAEYLIGASPEMYVRVQGKRVETCPISGTVRRGVDAIEDAAQIQRLLSSSKETSELTMCTDVDRNDKSRVCVPGSVQVIGRRQIELYSRVIHTVDHVEGQLRDEFDALDAFLSHMWVVTVTGAPKLWAMNFIEAHEKSPRKWYGGAVGWLHFNGNLNTGLVLRTMRIEQGIAEIRAGATLLYDSDPIAEEEEIRLKASAFLELLEPPALNQPEIKGAETVGSGLRVLLVDHQDSFVHTLANYFRQTGACVTTIRSDQVLVELKASAYDLVVLSPGPGRPIDFKVKETIQAVLEVNMPLFGVCLGLQGIVEYFGGELRVLKYPMHGKASLIHVLSEADLFDGFESSFTAGRYHSLYAHRETLPSSLLVSAESEEGIVMAVSHRTLPIMAVQFHPETILSLPNQAGLRIILNVMKRVKSLSSRTPL